MDKKYLNDEFDGFFDFPTDDKSQVSSVSCKLFAEHIAYPILMDNARLTTQRDELLAERARLVAKAGEVMREPVAWIHRNTQGVLTITESKPSWDESIWPPVFTESQLIAAQQRTAEACAKVCDEIAVTAWGCDSRFAEAIRNGEWREYL